MRSDLDALRERHVERETREELFRVQSGDWGWAKAFATTYRPEADGRRAVLVEVPRPGTPDGGF